MIKAEKVTKAYCQGKVKIEAVKDATVEIKRKETVLITGPSGAGKSTFLHMLGGLDTPSSGRILLDGADFYKGRDSARSARRNEKIGFVFQFYHLLPEFTVLENVMLPSLMRKGNGAKRKHDARKEALRLLEMVGLTSRVTHRPSELSGGESQRVAIARALINSPEALLCDEPTGNLDSKRASEITDCLWALKETHDMALVIVTHDENMRGGFDKTFRIRDGILERLKNGSKSIPEWEICR